MTTFKMNFNSTNYSYQNNNNNNKKNNFNINKNKKFYNNNTKISTNSNNISNNEFIEIDSVYEQPTKNINKKSGYKNVGSLMSFVTNGVNFPKSCGCGK